MSAHQGKPLTDAASAADRREAIAATAGVMASRVVSMLRPLIADAIRQALASRDASACEGSKEAKP